MTNQESVERMENYRKEKNRSEAYTFFSGEGKEEPYVSERRKGQVERVCQILKEEGLNYLEANEVLYFVDKVLRHEAFTRKYNA